MKPEDIRVGVLRIEGTNCEDEMAQCFRRLGTKAEIVHLNQLIGNVKEDAMKRDLFDYHILMFPGGFSAGDYVRAGTIFAARIKAKLAEKLREFVNEGRPIGGVCNGFQILVEIGLLPGLGCPKSTVCLEPTAVLMTNESNRFECRSTYLKMVNRGKCVFTKNICYSSVIYAPSAHAEGRFIMDIKDMAQKVKDLEDNDMIVFTYVDPNGSDLKGNGYPWNPNGSPYHIAGVCNPEGNVFGMMPHPERAFYMYQYPDWTRLKIIKGINPYEISPTAKVFESVVDYVSKNF